MRSVIASAWKLWREPTAEQAGILGIYLANMMTQNELRQLADYYRRTADDLDYAQATAAARRQPPCEKEDKDLIYVG